MFCRRGRRSACNNGNWSQYQHEFYVGLGGWHEYSVELNSSRTNYDFKIDGVYQNYVPLDDMYPEPMFAIRNYAKIQTGGMADSLAEAESEEEHWRSHQLPGGKQGRAP